MLAIYWNPRPGRKQWQLVECLPAHGPYLTQAQCWELLRPHAKKHPVGRLALVQCATYLEFCWSCRAFTTLANVVSKSLLPVWRRMKVANRVQWKKVDPRQQELFR